MFVIPSKINIFLHFCKSSIQQRASEGIYLDERVKIYSNQGATSKNYLQEINKPSESYYADWDGNMEL